MTGSQYIQGCLISKIGVTKQNNIIAFDHSIRRLKLSHWNKDKAMHSTHYSKNLYYSNLEHYSLHKNTQNFQYLGSKCVIFIYNLHIT